MLHFLAVSLPTFTLIPAYSQKYRYRMKKEKALVLYRHCSANSRHLCVISIVLVTYPKLTTVQAGMMKVSITSFSHSMMPSNCWAAVPGPCCILLCVLGFQFLHLKGPLFKMNTTFSFVSTNSHQQGCMHT